MSLLQQKRRKTENKNTIHRKSTNGENLGKKRKHRSEHKKKKKRRRSSESDSSSSDRESEGQ